MKPLEEFAFDPARCRNEIEALGNFLAANQRPGERAAIQPFFDAHPHLAAFLGSYDPDIGPANSGASNYEILGDFSADLVLGNYEQRKYLFVELEDCGDSSLFTKHGEKSTREWGRRFEHGFSQLVDWFYALDGARGTPEFERGFGYGYVRFSGMLVVGRSAGLEESEGNRLAWRTEKVLVNSIPVYCLTFDDLFSQSAQGSTITCKRPTSAYCRARRSATGEVQRVAAPARG